MFKDTKPEVLAPVGNAEMLYAAVRSGADAVYLGAKDFSARRNAENFDKEALKEAIEYCHIRGVRVYLTLNIVIKNSELCSAFDLAKEAYNLGIDGVIVADLGLARLLHEKIPALPLHASTQMTVHTPSALIPLKELGFEQVVVSRETSKEDLKALCEKAKELGIKIEVFVHGALCMSMSGQCLLSAYLGSRSGNRGLCAGPCRLPFKVTGGTGYDLSLKDLSLLDYITELCEMGAASFKIEGRMKRPEYVASATAAVRQAVDNAYTDPELKTILRDVFSRQGFTDGYYKNKTGREMFGIRTKEDVTSANRAFPLIHELYRNERQSVPIEIYAEVLKDKPLKVTFFDGESKVTAQGGVPAAAKSASAESEGVLARLSKLGGTPYYAEKTTARVDEGLFVSAGELNSLRREAAELLSLERAKVKRDKSDAFYPCETPEPPKSKEPKIFLRVEKISQIPDDLSDVAALIVPLEENIDSLAVTGIPLIAEIPRGIISESAVLQRLEHFESKGFTLALCGNLAAIELCKKAGLSPIADTGLNLANSEAVKTAELFGAVAAVISSEEQLQDIKNVSSKIQKGIIAYGNIPLMLFKNCPLKNGISCKDCDKKGKITDRMGIEFPVRCRMGYSELLNSRPIYLADRKDDFCFLDFIILYFTFETKEQTKRIISAYSKGLAPEGEYTRGLYYRGTI